MAIMLPKDHKFLTGFRFPELIPFEMNDVALNTILTSVFRLAILDGSDWSRDTSEDISSIARSVDLLATHPQMNGFSSSEGRRLVERVVHSTLIRSITNPKVRAPQIDTLIPYTLATFKVGFPTTRTSRQVDRFLYALLSEHWNGRRQEVRKFIEQVFGEGVAVQGAPTPSARRLPGPLPTLDVLSEISIAFVDGFSAVKSKRTSNPYTPSRPLPVVQDGFARDLYRFWDTYATRQSKSALIDQTVTLLALELSVMTLKLFHSVPALIESTEQLPTAMSGADVTTPPELYVDWVGDPRHLSRTLATACVRRDVSVVDGFTRAVFDLRYLHEVIDQVRRDRVFRTLIDEQIGDAGSGANLDTPRYMQGLLSLLRHPELQAELRWGARSHREAILKANRQESADDEEDIERPATEAERLMHEAEESGKTPIEQVQEVLYVVQGRKMRENNLRWLRSVGGVGTTYGLISGAGNRRTWTYSPGNELLTVLVQLCAVDYEGWNPAKGAEPRGFGLAHFLEWLERRFGIIVDRPPADLGFDGPEHVTAARDNLQALLRRLRQMGMFEDQSDDFTVQQITPPFAEGD